MMCSTASKTRAHGKSIVRLKSDELDACGVLVFAHKGAREFVDPTPFFSPFRVM